MSRRIERCDRCGHLFTGKRRKLNMMAEGRTPGVFYSDYFSRYYCDVCSEEVKKAVRRFEMAYGE